MIRCFHSAVKPGISKSILTTFPTCVTSKRPFLKPLLRLEVHSLSSHKKSNRRVLSIYQHLERPKCSSLERHTKQFAGIPAYSTPRCFFSEEKDIFDDGSQKRRFRATVKCSNKPSGNMKVATTVPVKNKDKVSEENVNFAESQLTNTMVDFLPITLQPYGRLARLDKPWGSMLLLWPCLWSTSLAADVGSFPDWELVGLFTAGSFIMRGAGCTINDMWDSEYDKKVFRTTSRPLASGELNHTQAMIFLAAQLSAGLGVLVSLPNVEYCFILGASSLPLVVAYPLMKRYTRYPQFVLGLTFNWGAIMGYAAVHGALDYSVILPLYGSGICWTLVYDTLYAHQDKVDDSRLGLQSTALTFGDDQTKPILFMFSTFSLVGWSAAGYNADVISPVFYGGCGLAYSHLLWQVYTANLSDHANLAERFKSNQTLGAIIFASCVTGNFLS
mmetsp:Transcript_32288/g.39293  ORF Transcript_32288/g.39293 Transcript_32288/m.39293 type:complete len:444 (+) Transcript_32288:296-1627(+)